MKAVKASALGKIILLGEHAVVYGHPAIAVPVAGVRVTVEIEPAARGSGLSIYSGTLRETFRFGAMPPHHPLSVLVSLVLKEFNQSVPDARAAIESSIPVAGGLGSGAAVSAALARALARWWGRTLTPQELSSLVFKVEKLHHGTPSGIDNTVICFEMPVYYVRGVPPQTLIVREPLDLIVADTGIRSPTKTSVDAVRNLWQSDQQRFDAAFAEIGSLVREARQALETGRLVELGILMTKNQDVLRTLSVSSANLERLIVSAMQLGALGAKLSGGGRGGIMVALVEPDSVVSIMDGLRAAGATNVFHTSVQ